MQKANPRAGLAVQFSTSCLIFFKERLAVSLQDQQASICLFFFSFLFFFFFTVSVHLSAEDLTVWPLGAAGRPGPLSQPKTGAGADVEPN